MDHKEGMAWTEKRGNIPEEAHFVLLTVVKVKVAQLCPTVRDPRDYKVHGIF